ncbi:hypothetical protein NDU88_001973 [Pleurodeles waltl]|uniref:Uncharacterized protein n=1 Tax=Pleurodeles waltl TaxID=8319 RepID=A0AAV7RCQ2_PLEWA|nr:hypothetical protein NDU88_001973 [Pleurodeles waltl]
MRTFRGMLPALWQSECPGPGERKCGEETQRAWSECRVVGSSNVALGLAGGPILVLGWPAGPRVSCAFECGGPLCTRVPEGLADACLWVKVSDVPHRRAIRWSCTPLTPSMQREIRLAGHREDSGLGVPAGEPSRVELLATIQGSRTAIEGKIESVATEILEEGGRDRLGTHNSNWRSRETAGPQELSSGGGESPTRIEIQEDGTMALTDRDVTPNPTRTAVAEDAKMNGTAT